MDKLEWKSTKQRIYMDTLVFKFKIKHNMPPDYLVSKLLYTRGATIRMFSNGDDFPLPRYNGTYTQNSLWHAGLNEFNKLKLNVKIVKWRLNGGKRKENSSIFKKFPALWTRS
jgi:hypothetical protein